MSASVSSASDTTSTTLSSASSAVSPFLSCASHTASTALCSASSTAKSAVSTASESAFALSDFAKEKLFTTSSFFTSLTTLVTVIALIGGAFYFMGYGDGVARWWAERHNKTTAIPKENMGSENAQGASEREFPFPPWPAHRYLDSNHGAFCPSADDKKTRSYWRRNPADSLALRFQIGHIQIGYPSSPAHGFPAAITGPRPSCILRSSIHPRIFNVIVPPGYVPRLNVDCSCLSCTRPVSLSPVIRT
jgi:hypothetical protein